MAYFQTTASVIMETELYSLIHVIMSFTEPKVSFVLQKAHLKRKSFKKMYEVQLILELRRSKVLFRRFKDYCFELY